MRYKLIFSIFFLIWVVMIVRLYHISMTKNFYYEQLAKENIEQKRYIKPVRGEIVDSKGKLLAMNRIGFSISIKPHLKRDSKQLENIVDKLVQTFPDLNKTIMMKVYKKKSSAYNHKYIKVVDFVRYHDMMSAYPQLSIDENLEIEAQTKRYYPYGRYGAHIIGYTGRSNNKENEKDFVVDQVGVIGKAGLERQYNKVLQGELGYTINKVTATNKEIDKIKYIKPIDNRNLELHLDIDLQMMIYKLMKTMSGAVIVMRTNGDIVAAVSTPSYDPNLFVGGISKKNWVALQEDLEHPFTNRFIHGTYPPGSTIKMGVAIANAMSNKNTIEQTEHCRGFIRIGRSSHKFRCWKKHGHGTVGLRRAIQESCDVFFYNKSLDMGIDSMSKSLKTLGLGVKTGVDLPREYRGTIPDKRWKMKRYKKPWYMGETVIAAIGQGYDNITPLQIARYTALLGTSNLVTPHFAKSINGKVIPAEIKPIDLDSKLMEQIHLGMYDVCNTPGGTAYKHLHGLPITVLGKTGTSQVVSIPQNVVNRAKEEDMEYWRRSHALLTTYAPFKNPKYVITTIIEHGGHGGSTNGPIVAEIYRWMYNHRYFHATTLPVEESKEMNTSQESDSNISKDTNETENIVPPSVEKKEPTQKEHTPTPMDRVLDRVLSDHSWQNIDSNLKPHSTPINKDDEEMLSPF